MHKSRCGFRQIPSKSYQGPELPEHSRRQERARVLGEMWRARNNELDRFIVSEESKASLAYFRSTEMSQRYGKHPGNELVVSGGFREILNMWSSHASRESLQGLSLDHEGADTRILLYASEAAVRGYQEVNVLCRDTDVLVLLLAHRQDLCQEIWMFSGTSRPKRYIPVHKIIIARGEEEVPASLPYHHWL